MIDKDSSEEKHKKIANFKVLYFCEVAEIMWGNITRVCCNFNLYFGVSKVNSHLVTSPHGKNKYVK